jgi:Putative phage serine protease XkdF
MSILSALRRSTSKGDAMTVDIDSQQTEVVIYKRDFSTEERRKLASEGKALPSGAYPIDTAADLHPAAVLARSGHGDVAAAKALIARRAKELKVPDPLDDSTETAKKSEFAVTVPIWKSEIEGKVWGIVLEPNLEDSEGDTVSPEEIQKACHDFMVASRKADVQHNGTQVDADLIENYIAPHDMQLAGKSITKGSWVQGWWANDPVLKRELAEGKLTGLSMGGSAIREPVAA